MKHIILDPDLIYSKEHNNYYFKYGNGGRSSYFRVRPEVVINSNNTCKADSFRVVQSKRTGYHSIVSGVDTSQRCLAFFNCVANDYETIELDEDLTSCEIIEMFSTSTCYGNNEVKVIAILHPSRPFVLKYYNVKLKRTRYEFVLYNYITGMIERRTLTEAEREQLRRDTEILSDCTYDTSKFKVTKDMLANLSEDDIKSAEAYYDKYYSHIKDA